MVIDHYDQKVTGSSSRSLSWNSSATSSTRWPWSRWTGSSSWVFGWRFLLYVWSNQRERKRQTYTPGQREENPVQVQSRAPPPCSTRTAAPQSRRRRCRPQLGSGFHRWKEHWADVQTLKHILHVLFQSKMKTLPWPWRSCWGFLFVSLLFSLGEKQNGEMQTLPWRSCWGSRPGCSFLCCCCQGLMMIIIIDLGVLLVQGTMWFLLLPGLDDDQGVLLLIQCLFSPKNI